MSLTELRLNRRHSASQVKTEASPPPKTQTNKLYYYYTRTHTYTHNPILSSHTYIVVSSHGTLWTRHAPMWKEPIAEKKLSSVCLL